MKLPGVVECGVAGFSVPPGTIDYFGDNCIDTNIMRSKGEKNALTHYANPPPQDSSTVKLHSIAYRYVGNSSQKNFTEPVKNLKKN